MLCRASGIAYDTARWPKQHSCVLRSSSYYALSEERTPVDSLLKSMDIRSKGDLLHLLAFWMRKTQPGMAKGLCIARSPL